MTNTPGNIHIGPGEVYISVTVPATGSSVALTNGAPATGTHVGATLGPAVWRYRASPFVIRQEQTPAPVGEYIQEEDLQIEFTLGELTYANLKLILAKPGDQTSFVSVGGQSVPNTASVLIVSKKRDGKYVEAMVYSATFVEDRSFEVQRRGTTGVRIMCHGIGDVTRADGDQLGFMHPAVVSA